ncbi:hypothetical protein HDU96_003715 [Phlyctochytrium bullatum]|nr:hypothetical protein HDU96_003715 [Phlyctochytrium bullatum]
MRAVFLLALVFAIALLFADPALAFRRNRRRAAKEALTSANCKRGEPKVKSWERKYDKCDLPKEVAAACQRKDGRLAYDEIWDSRRVLGYDCGRKQNRYKGNTWEKICTTVAGKTTIETIYEAAKCPKVVAKQNKKDAKQNTAKKN